MNVCATGSLAAPEAERLRSLRDNTFAVEQFDFDRQRIVRRFQMLNETIDIDRGVAVSTFFGCTKIFSINVAGNNAQRDFAIDAAEGQIVDFISEWWNVGALRGINIDSKQIVSIEIEVGCQFKRERRVAAFVFSQALRR